VQARFGARRAEVRAAMRDALAAEGGWRIKLYTAPDFGITLRTTIDGFMAAVPKPWRSAGLSEA
jgi:hypothetical protein